MRQKQGEERKQKILELYLACHTQEEIAEVVWVARSTVTEFISNVKNGGLADFDITPDSLQLYNLWQFSAPDSRYGLDYPGRIPAQIVENVLYYYTEPFDLVVDPMVGGGTTIDVCRAMYRRYRAYDIRPVRNDIKEYDITQGFPRECKERM